MDFWSLVAVQLCFKGRKKKKRAVFCNCRKDKLGRRPNIWKLSNCWSIWPNRPILMVNISLFGVSVWEWRLWLTRSARLKRDLLWIRLTSREILSFSRLRNLVDCILECQSLLRIMCRIIRLCISIINMDIGFNSSKTISVWRASLMCWVTLWIRTDMFLWVLLRWRISHFMEFSSILKKITSNGEKAKT